MPNGEKRIPLGDLPPQERISQVLDQPCLAMKGDEPLNEAIANSGEGYSIGQSTIVFRSEREVPALGTVETLHVLGPTDLSSGLRSYQRYESNSQISTVIRTVNAGHLNMGELTGGPGQIRFPVAEYTEARPELPGQLVVKYQEIFVIPGQEKLKEKGLLAQVHETYETFQTGEETTEFDFANYPSAVAVLETGRLIFLGPPDTQGRREGWHIPIRDIGTDQEEPQRFRAEVEVVHLGEEQQMIRVEDLPRRNEISRQSNFDKTDIAQGEIAVLSFKNTDGNPPSEGTWRMTTHPLGIEKIVKITPPNPPEKPRT